MIFQYMHLKFRLNRDLKIEIRERPLLWMNENELQKLREELVQFSSKILKTDQLDYGIFSSDLEAFGKSYITLLRDQKKGALLGFNAMPVIKLQNENQPRDEVFHLGLVMVDPEARSQGLTQILYGLSCMMIFFRKGLRPITISSVTQVPAVFGMVSEIFSDAVPAVQNPETTNYESYKIAGEIMDHHRAAFGVGDDAGFNHEKLIITNAYTGGSDHLKKTFEQSPKHRNEAVNQFCEERLDYDRGDDFLQIARLDFDALRRYVQKALPKNSLLYFSAISMFAFAQNIVLPPLHWLDTRKPFNSLEVRKSDV